MIVVPAGDRPPVPADRLGSSDEAPAGRDTGTRAAHDGRMDARDRDAAGRPQQARPRDASGRPLPYGDPRGVDPVPEQALPPREALALAQSLLDQGRAFSAHEVLEAAWKAAPDGERALWQGLAQLCVGITHAQRGNAVGATRLVRRGADRLRPYAGAPPGSHAPHGLDVPGLLRWCDEHALAPAGTMPRLAGPSPTTGGTLATGRHSGPPH